MTGTETDLSPDFSGGSPVAREEFPHPMMTGCADQECLALGPHSIEAEFSDHKRILFEWHTVLSAGEISRARNGSRTHFSSHQCAG